MKKKILITALAAVLAVSLWGCADETPDLTKDPDASISEVNRGILQLTAVVTEDTIASLEDYPDLRKADLTGSTCYAAIADYIARHPEVEVIYTVDLGGSVIRNDSTALRLVGGTYDPAKLVERLAYLPKVTDLVLPDTTLSGEQMAALKEKYPNVAVDYSILFNGKEVELTATEVDLSGMPSSKVAEYAAKLSLLDDLKTVELMAADGTCSLNLSEVAALKKAVPEARFHYAFEFFGTKLTSDDTTVSLKAAPIGTENAQAVRDLLAVMNGCTQLVLDECGIDNETMASIRSEHPQTEVVWRVKVGDRSWLTNVTTLKAVGKVDNAGAAAFKYLTSVKYIDMAQNTALTDISFVTSMEGLEIAIFSNSAVMDLSPLASCKKLEYLELANCKKLSDLSPLASCTALKYLNLGHSAVKDLSVLKKLPLELLSYVNSGLSADAFSGLSGKVTYAPLSDAKADAYGKGWRYNDDNSYTASFKKVREVFGYDQEVQNPSDPLTGNAAVKKITLVVTADTISQLEKYPNLEEADLTGSTCYEAILSYMKKHPKVDVTFTVPLGGKTVKNTVTDLELKQGDHDYEILKKNLKYVTSLKNLTFPSTELTAGQINSLKQAYPKVAIRYTMKIQATVIDGTVSAVDLSAMDPSQIDSVLQQLDQYPNVAWVELMTSNGTSQLSIADVKRLQQGAPNVTFHYRFKLGGKTVSTTDERIEFIGATLKGIGEQNLRNALDILSGCTYFLLDNRSGPIDNAAMASIRDDYPNIKVVWRIHHDAINTYNVPGRYMQKDSLLTDTLVLRAVYGVNDKNSSVFKYLTDVRYVDLGHDTEMSDISFLGYMPDLEIAILSGSPIRDLSPLAGCKKLEFLEIAWCGHVKDISPLAACESLKYLNLAHTQVKDLTPLKGLDMQMISYVNSGNRVGFTEATWAEIAKMFPNCWLTYNPLRDNNASPYGVGWRYKQGGGYTPIYRKVRDVFGLDYMG